MYIKETIQEELEKIKTDSSYFIKKYCKIIGPENKILDVPLVLKPIKHITLSEKIEKIKKNIIKHLPPTLK